MVDATRDAFDNIGASLEDVAGTVVFLLIAVVYSCLCQGCPRNNGTFRKMSTVTVTSTRDAFDIVAPLANVVDLVTFLIEVGARSPSQDIPSF